MTDSLVFELLGTGTSTGIPEIGCDCEVCRSEDPRDKRLRTAMWLTSSEISLLVDTPPDLRQQCLRSKIHDVDGVFFTHLHYDHVFGLDDLRKFNAIHQKHIDIYLPREREKQFKNIYYYTLKPAKNGLFKPKFNLVLTHLEKYEFGELSVQPLQVFHGDEEIRGYLFERKGKKLAYITDCKTLPDETMELIKGVDVLILNAIWRNRRKHYNHLDLEEALEMVDRIKPKQTYFTHFSHYMGKHAEVEPTLPENVKLAYDGLTIEF